jgi:hypothetical protein
MSAPDAWAAALAVAPPHYRSPEGDGPADAMQLDADALVDLGLASPLEARAEVGGRWLLRWSVRAAGLPASHYAQRLGVSPRTLRRWLQGSKPIPSNIVLRLLHGVPEQ